ncbi:septation protein SepH [Rhizohabitans arisaemae]|uniref:septation protein SepH n=1 Tax=Rhizohabitans arisaemae TaxID=2720610 RepID=UPI0024B1B6B7|nr:septation protein SepH [Rhizohabitans arisaemae]
MQELRLVAVSEDGSYLVLASAGRGTRFTLPVDDRLRAAIRGNFSRLGQYEIEVESPLRPKEIQARIRAGETAEEIAATAGIPVERVRWFEGPVLQEREYIAVQAQRISVRLPGESGPGPILGDLVSERLTRRGVPAEEIDWDSCKRDDGIWRVKLGFILDGVTRHAEWLFDPRRRHVSPGDEEAHRLSSGNYEEEIERENATVTPFVPRLAAKLQPLPPVMIERDPPRSTLQPRNSTHLPGSPPVYTFEPSATTPPVAAPAAGRVSAPVNPYGDPVPAEPTRPDQHVSDEAVSQPPAEPDPVSHKIVSAQPETQRPTSEQVPSVQTTATPPAVDPPATRDVVPAEPAAATPQTRAPEPVEPAAAPPDQAKPDPRPTSPAAAEPTPARVRPPAPRLAPNRGPSAQPKAPAPSPAAAAPRPQVAGPKPTPPRKPPAPGLIPAPAARTPLPKPPAPAAPETEAPAHTGKTPKPVPGGKPAEPEPTRPARKSGRGRRASVPSWDEIMFGARRSD